jgi:hypothetical protein
MMLGKRQPPEQFQAALGTDQPQVAMVNSQKSSILPVLTLGKMLGNRNFEERRAFGTKN